METPLIFSQEAINRKLAKTLVSEAGTHHDDHDEWYVRAAGEALEASADLLKILGASVATIADYRAFLEATRNELAEARRSLESLGQSLAVAMKERDTAIEQTQRMKSFLAEFQIKQQEEVASLQ